MPYSLVKGAALSKQCYGNESERRYNDIDLLVPKAFLGDLENHLLQMGFHSRPSSMKDYRLERILCLSSSHQIIPYVRTIGNQSIVIDVNFDIFWGEYEGKKINMEQFLADAIEMDIYGTKVKTLPPLKAMVQLVLHHYKDMNSIFLLATRNTIRSEMFKDIYFLLKNNIEDISVQNLLRISKEYEIIPYVFYVLFYTKQIFGDSFLLEYLEAFRTPEGEKLLNAYGLCKKERKEWTVDFRTRLESNDLNDYIEGYLTERDRRKIQLNKQIFMGG